MPGRDRNSAARNRDLHQTVNVAFTGRMDRLIPSSEDVRLFLLAFAGGLVFFSAFLA